MLGSSVSNLDSLAKQKFEIRTNNDGSRSVTGYFATFGTLSHDLGGFRERIQKGAFSKSLRENPDVLCYFNHNSDLILGRVSSGTLNVVEDAKGLRFTCQLPDTSAGRDLTALMERGDVAACSFGFLAQEDEWDEIDGQVVRTLVTVRLFEGSIVGSPAYPQTVADLRSCPLNLRSKLSKRDEDDEDDDDDNDDIDCDDPENIDDPRCDEERCDCSCRSCESGDCDECTNPDCDDDDCDDCPVQTRSAHMNLLLRKLRS